MLKSTTFELFLPFLVTLHARQILSTGFLSFFLMFLLLDKFRQQRGAEFELFSRGYGLTRLQRATAYKQPPKATRTRDGRGQPHAFGRRQVFEQCRVHNLLLFIFDQTDCIPDDFTFRHFKFFQSRPILRPPTSFGQIITKPNKKPPGRAAIPAGIFFPSSLL